MDVYVDDGNYEPDEDAVADAQLESSMKLLNVSTNCQVYCTEIQLDQLLYLFMIHH